MAIKVDFTTGASSATVEGLFQWDYGQVLEIECPEVGSEIVEIHFACPHMTEAIVRPCTFANGIGSVTIPDRCLEQTGTITAWIYKVNSTAGHTIKTITLPLTQRTRPSKSHDIPVEAVDKYGELIEQVNIAVEALESGNVTVAKALSANTATSATTAQSAASATYASSAGSATSAGLATNASRVMVDPDYPYCSITITNGSGHTDKNFTEALYLVVYSDSNNKTFLSGVGYIGTNTGSLKTYSIPLGLWVLYYEEYSSDSTASGAGAEVVLINLDESSPVVSKNGTLTFIRIGEIAHG